MYCVISIKFFIFYLRKDERLDLLQRANAFTVGAHGVQHLEEDDAHGVDVNLVFK